MTDQTKNMLIGLFVIAAIGLFTWVMLFLHPTIGDNATSLRVRFSDVDKISLGTRVTYAGKPVGEVVDISLIENGREGREDTANRVYMYELELRVDSSVFVYSTDNVTVYTSGLLGERSIGIVPRKPKDGEKITLLNNQVIYAGSAASVEQALNLLESLGEKAEDALDEVINVIRVNSEDFNGMLVSARGTLDKAAVALDRTNETDVVGVTAEALKEFGETMAAAQAQLDEMEQHQLWEKIANVADNVSGITESLNQPEKWGDIIDNVHLLTSRLNELEERVEDTWDKVDSSMDEIFVAAENVRTITEDGKAFASEARNIMNNVAAGEGTLGRLVASDDLYLRVSSLMSKGETVLNDMNHYGLLFHLDKEWQRTRAKRIHLLADLETPRQFKAYFDDEITSINTSLSRVSMLMREAREDGRRDDIVEDGDFAETFADLLRQVDNLQEMLKYYNQSLIEQAR